MSQLSLLAARENRVFMRLKAIHGLVGGLLYRRGENCLPKLNQSLQNLTQAIEETLNEAKKLQQERMLSTSSDKLSPARRVSEYKEMD